MPRPPHSTLTLTKSLIPVFEKLGYPGLAKAKVEAPLMPEGACLSVLSASGSYKWIAEDGTPLEVPVRNVAVRSRLNPATPNE